MGSSSSPINTCRPPPPLRVPGRPGRPRDLVRARRSAVLPVSEPVIELEPTSNRVDCFGVYGVARELHAVTAAELAPAPWDGDAEATGDGAVTDYASVTVEVPELCPRFSARVFTEVQIGPSPPWLKARLTAAGMRPVNNVVDITNYVMLMTAQPLHAFDLDKVPGGEIIVRTAREGETMTTLDGNERRFDADAVLVCDRDGPTGVAGIMGGLVSEVSDSTTRVLLEVATWDGVNVLRTSRKLGLRSDASNRNEKQLHPALALRAQRIASRLLVELCGARLVPGTIDAAGEIPQARRVRLRGGRAARLLGLAIPRDDQLAYLRRLEFEVETDAEDLETTVPFHRHYDVTREVDLIEEVGRIHGYAEHLPATLPAASSGGRLSREQGLRRRAEDLARDLGFDGVVTLSLTDPGQPERLRIGADDPRSATIAISNPLSSEHSVLRTTLLGGLLDVARYNLARDAPGVAIYESGRVYLRAGEPLGETTLGASFPGWRPAPAFEPWRLACLASGPLAGAGWRGEPGEPDFYALKGALEGIAAGLGCVVEVEPASEPFLQPRPGGPGAGRWCRGGLDRGGPSARLPGLGSGVRRRVRGRSGAARRRLAERVRAVRGRDHLSGGRAGHRGRRRRGAGGGAGARRGRRGGRRAAALDRRLRPLPRRAGRRGPQEPRPAARVPGC